MNLRLFDSHSHLYKKSKDVVKENFSFAEKVLFSSYSQSDWNKLSELKKAFKQKVYTAFGIHPWLAKTYIDKGSQTILTKDFSDFDAIGETGLDGFGSYNRSLKQQIILLTMHIRLSKEVMKPLVLHSVRANKDLLRILKQEKGPYSGFVHSFAGSQEEADEFMRLGFYLSFGPNLFKPKTASFKKALEDIPLDRFLLESDAPDQSDNSKVLIDVANELAKYKKMSCDEVVKYSKQNFLKVLRIDDGMDAGYT